MILASESPGFYFPFIMFGAVTLTYTVLFSLAMSVHRPLDVVDYILMAFIVLLLVIVFPLLIISILGRMRG